MLLRTAETMMTANRSPISDAWRDYNSLSAVRIVTHGSCFLAS
jgi:hypothetical protein